MRAKAHGSALVFGRQLQFGPGLTLPTGPVLRLRQRAPQERPQTPPEIVVGALRVAVGTLEKTTVQNHSLHSELFHVPFQNRSTPF